MLEKGGDGDIGSRRNRFGGQARLVSKYLLANLTQEIPIDTLENALFGGNPYRKRHRAEARFAHVCM